ncbi:hypothetical protein SAMN05216226_1235 [Halovenus aranensis]|uniref:Uncharacterized protein n=1 Tax=Halovenus aranensis TaxID=890420 RepID=A0A1G8ZFW9_9EURY|nr:hypothetical protein [Halovenus aranensis]SDK13918.1 hypothetical protein SAMN05216226_1235 [Halovenus aranensis]
MRNPPKIPSESNSQEELEQHISQLHSYIDFLDEEIEESKKAKVEEIQLDLEEVEEKISQISGDFQSIQDRLESIQNRLEKFNEEYLQQYGDGPSEEAKDKFFDAAGWHPEDH